MKACKLRSGYMAGELQPPAIPHKESDPVQTCLDGGVKHIRSSFCDSLDLNLFEALRAELFESQTEQSYMEREGHAVVTKMDEATEKCLLSSGHMPAHTFVLQKLEEILHVQGIGWGSNLYEEASVPLDFHRDGNTHGTGENGEYIEANVSIMASFGGSRILTFLHCTTGREFSFLQENGDIFAFNRLVDHEFMHGLRPSINNGMERISVVMFGRYLESSEHWSRRPLSAQVVSVCRPRNSLSVNCAKLLQFTGVFVHEGQDIAELVELRRAKRHSSVLSAHSLGPMKDVCQSLEAHIVAIPTRSGMLGSLECVIIEPHDGGDNAIQKSQDTLGFVICLQGLPLSAGNLQEWAATAEKAGWLRLGIKVVVPNLQMSSALETTDFEAVAGALLEMVRCQDCLIVCKDEGAMLCLKIFAAGSLTRRVAGVVLAGPSLPPPAACFDLDVPIFLLWARDDEITPFSDLDVWLETLDSRSGPTAVRATDLGGHLVDRVLENQEVAWALRSFTTAAFLLAALPIQDEIDTMDCLIPLKISHRFQRLCAEMPGFLLNCSGVSADQLSTLPSRAVCCQLSQQIQSWIHADMRILSASE